MGKPSSAARLPMDLCPLGLPIDAAPLESRPLCDAPKGPDEAMRKYPGALLGIPMGIAGVGLSPVGCPLIMLGLKMFVPKRPQDALKGNDLSYGLMFGVCVAALAIKGYDIGTRALAAPLIGIKRISWDCPKSIFEKRPRTGTIVDGSVRWDKRPQGLTSNSVDRIIWSDTKEVQKVDGEILSCRDYRSRRRSN